jgi:hypothetical protein
VGSVQPGLFESLPLACSNCGAGMRIIAVVTDAASVKQIPTHIGEPPRPPPITPARGPPAWDEAPEPPRVGLRPSRSARARDRVRPAYRLVAAVSLPQETVQLLSSAGGRLCRRCSLQHPETRAPALLPTPRCSVLTTHPSPAIFLSEPTWALKVAWSSYPFRKARRATIRASLGKDCQIAEHRPWPP